MSTNVRRAALVVLLVIAGSTVLGGSPAAAAAPWHLLADVTCQGNTSIWSMDPDGGHKQLYLQGAVDPAISPDDSQVAYATPAGVFVAPVHDPSAAQLVAAGDTHPSWSPDGSRLVV